MRTLQVQATVSLINNNYAQPTESDASEDQRVPPRNDHVRLADLLVQRHHALGNLLVLFFLTKVF